MPAKPTHQEKAQPSVPATPAPMLEMRLASLEARLLQVEQRHALTLAEVRAHLYGVLKEHLGIAPPAVKGDIPQGGR